MRRPQGYGITVEPGKADVEVDSFTCRHCNSIVFVKPRQDPSEMGGFCTLCMGHVCGNCAGKSCEPFEKKLEAMERRDKFLRSMGVG